MANDDNPNPRCASSRPEDNPFIAFRRFADSQVSSLLNTVFTLPATMANYSNAHQAREQCLFGKADKRQCGKLDQLEAESAELWQEGRELFREGNLQAVLRNSESMLRLDQKAEQIRRDIIQEAIENGDIKPEDGGKVALVERVASQKGRDWGAEWDWGIPKPFDSSRMVTEDSEKGERDSTLRLLSEVQKFVAAFDGATLDDSSSNAERRRNSSEKSTERRSAREWSWARSWQWPLPADQSRYNDDSYAPHVLEADRKLGRSGVPWREAYEDLTRRHEVSKQNRSRGDEPYDKPMYDYSHDHEDQHEEPPTQASGYISPEYQQQSQQETRVESGNHDSYQNHAEGADTELDVYEQLAVAYDKLNLPIPSFSAAQSDRIIVNTPSVLSTLTTTERTVAPDGSVTTKVVLKKRFTDGREESSETVHTEKSQESNSIRSHIPGRSLGQSQDLSNEKPPNSSSGPGNGWFWSR